MSVIEDEAVVVKEVEPDGPTVDELIAENNRLREIALDAVVRAREIDALLPEVARLRAELDAAPIRTEDLVASVIAAVLPTFEVMAQSLDVIASNANTSRKKWWQRGR